IGCMESGVGGLSVLREAILKMPHENFIFYGDNKNAPYGEKPEEEIRELSIACVEKLISEGVKMVVIACNTATTVAVRYLREHYELPVISIEPAIKPALSAPGNKKVIVMATPTTLSQKRYFALKERVGHQERLIEIPCAGLAKLVEKGDFESEELKSYITNKLLPFSKEDVGGVVIGCTHYSFIAPLIKKIASEIFRNEIEIHDGRYGTVRQIKRVLENSGLITDSTENGSIRLLSSGGEESISLMKKILFEE
ncbi:MAG: glutamate racemase, partial [Christensenellaceae bacterium]|nr:glutamate racemase [Christensenellaceae bacterium]